MLEKIGLPAKPSMRGRTWVLDSSHCQGCSSQFTFFNRKHHCRRCGGLFCNNCTLQRMYLRGQGDQPVRICNPCKELEEAARFTARQGRKNQAPKGGLRTSAKSDDEVLQQILGTDGKPESPTDINSTGDDHASAAADASNSTLQEGEDSNQNRKNELSESSSRDGTIHGHIEKDSATPEELRQQAQEEKKKYHHLKKEGKSEEALQAFKRGKEIERHAEVLELSLRKNRRKAGSFNVGTVELKQEELGDPERKAPDSSGNGEELDLAKQVKKKKSTIRGKDKSDDISSELKELGWSDADLQDVDRKPGKMTLDGELHSLIRESHNSNANSPGIDFASSTDWTQVLAHKKRALALKREGKLGEAKEELKKAKILEKQQEEQEMIGQDVESDDELAALIRGMDSESKGEAYSLGGGLGVKFGEQSIFDPSHITTMAGEFDDDVGIDVTDDDSHDPEIAAALRSLGWQEEDPCTGSLTQSLVDAKCNSHRDTAALQLEVLSLKREALALKRAGNAAEAMEQLRQAKMLEKELHNITSQHTVNDSNLKYEVSNQVDPQIPGSGNVGKKSRLEKNASLMNLHDEDGESIEVTDEDMGDPELVKALREVGWQEADQDSVPRKKSQTVLSDQNSSVTSPFKMSKTKTELQKELLGIKRKALNLRRNGRIDEADAELNRGKLLEKQLEEMETLQKTQNMQASILYDNSKPSRKDRGSDVRVSSLAVEEDDKLIEVTEEDMVDPELFKELNGLGWKEADHERVSRNSGSPNILPAQSYNMSSPASPFQMSKSKAELQKELLGLKRKALALRREGRFEEADAELSKGKFLENQLEDIETLQNSQNSRASILQDNSKPTQKGRVSDLTSLSFKVNEDAERVKRQDVHDPSMLVALRTTDRRNDSDKGDEMKVLPISHQPLDTVPDAFTDASKARGLKTLENNRTSLTGICDDIQDTFMPINVNGEPNKNISSKSQPQNVADLLTGDTWKAPLLEQVENLVDSRDNEPENSAIPSTSDISKGTSLTKVQVKINSISDVNPEQNIQHASAAFKAKAVVLNVTDVSSMSNTSQCNAETAEISASQTAPQTQDIQQQILSHKRKALALKREGKLAEAKEELQLAKLLERKRELEGNSGSQVSSSSPSYTVNASEQMIKPLEDAIPNVESSQTAMKFVPALFSDSTPVSLLGSENDVSSKKQQIHKQAPTKDRLKLQRESLAHKRRALALRREGKVEEAEAEFELAKSLENQMDELAGNNTQAHHSSVGIGSDDGSLVEDILDPHLLSALKGIGWKESDIFSQVPTKGLDAKNKGRESLSNSVRSNFGNEASQVNVEQTLGLKEERAHLEEKIKAEKLRALNLKRAGKQAEALDALRGAKQLEKKLLSLAA